MDHTYTNLIYHLVWSTKNREAFITEEMEPRFHQYLGGAIRNEDGICLTINGTEDHVHILAKFKPTKAIADVVGRIKANSSGWVHKEFSFWDFNWQDGYGAFTVSASQIDKVQKYIENQKAHHRGESFRDEFIRLLEKHEVDYQLKYLWK